MRLHNNTSESLSSPSPRCKRGYYRFLPVAVFTAIGLLLFAFYCLFYKYHFFWLEQNQIFLMSSDWLSTYFAKPAWAACMAGDYLTQFFYYLYAGPLILALLVSLTSGLIFVALKNTMPKWAAWLITAVATATLVFCSFSSAFRLASLVSVTGGIVIYLAVRKLGYFANLFIPLAYWMFGFGAIILAILIILGAGNLRRILIIAPIAIALTLATPLALMRTYVVHYIPALIYPDIARPVLPEWEFETTLGVENEYLFGNYDKAINMAQNIPTPNTVTSFYYYLSQAKRDSLPDNLLKYPIKELGTLYVIGEDTPKPVINMMNDLYYELGDMMYAERGAMMHNVFSGQNRNVRMIKRLAEVNLVSGDTLAALKHLRILSNTIPYRKWALKHINNINASSNANCKGRSDNMTADNSREIEYRRKYINTQDTLRLGDNCRTILLELLDSNPSNTMALDYLLCTDLLLKEMDTFKADYDKYCISNGTPRIRPLYQQALMIYLAGTNAPEEEWQKYIRSPQQLQRFREYNAKRGSKAFADTYWYYFDTHKR